MECVTFHLHTKFHNDAAEMECFYIRNRLKKPNKVPILHFVHRIMQFNSYLDLFLPVLLLSCDQVD